MILQVMLQDEQDGAGNHKKNWNSRNWNYGATIAWVFAQQVYQVVLYDLKEEFLQKG